MSKGSVIIHVRIPASLMVKLQAEYLRWEANGLQADRSMSDYIRSAIENKMSHAKRSRRTKGKMDPSVTRRLEQFAREQGLGNIKIADEPAGDGCVE